MASETAMNYRETSTQIASWRTQIAELRQKMREARSAAEPEPVRDYELRTAAGTQRLSQLFGAHHDLIAIHNMGRGCVHCTLWADGFNGLYSHIADRAAFVVTSPDAVDVQRDFAASRGWRFPMASHQGSSFAEDMGYRSEKRGWLPGVSIFRRKSDRIVRVADTGFQPNDDFCSLWHFFDMLPEGAGDWRAKFVYQ
jgi:predicted dithiol-disulfide oxidoreductase (DUF899 family)